MISILLKFQSPFHLAGWRDDHASSETIIHSDTLVAALFQTLANTGKAAVIEQLLADDSFRISSAFPYKRHADGRITYFLPKPFTSITGEEQVNDGISSSERKANKKIRFIDAVDLKQWAENAGNTLTFSSANRQGAYYSSHNNQVVNGALQIGPTISKQVQERVKVPRNQDEDPEPFYFERVTIEPQDGGLYVLLEVGSLQTEVMRSLELLGQSGIGSDRTVGNGMFTVEQGPSFPWPLIKNTVRAMALSLYLPASKEEFQNAFPDRQTNGSSCGYDLVRRGGWLTAAPHLGDRKKQVHMILEGSVSQNPQKIQGSVADLRPKPDFPHPIYRFGKPLLYPIAH